MSTKEFTQHDVHGDGPTRYDVLQCVEARARTRLTPYSTSLEIATALRASLEDVERLVAGAVAFGELVEHPRYRGYVAVTSYGEATLDAVLTL